MLERYAYVGCRTTRERNARGEGISVFGVDVDGRWHLQGVEATLPNPSYLALRRDGRRLYTVHGDGSEITVFRVDGSTLSSLGSDTVAGLNPVDLLLSPDERFLVATNHLTGALVTRAVDADGCLGSLVSYLTIQETLGPHRTEQTSTKPHQARFSPCGRWLAVPNKGSDTVSAVAYDSETGQLSLRPEGTARVREGSGPRNIVFSRLHELAYLVGELDSTVTVLSTAGALLKPLRTHSTLPDDAFAQSRAAAVVLSPDGSTLFVSNRGHDTICAFEVDRETGLLSTPRWSGCGGRTPRFATAYPGGSGLVVANEDSDTIVALGRDVTGETILLANTPSPVCVVFGPSLATDASGTRSDGGSP
ncbi:beta-propeller fold lactonase family protein [Aureimonas sp. ME7]|uniref:lactonase family protein n=1 Tax=Aureimonas sp. ME7 TaxID=2744252 RepID=UPI0015F365DD|nr:beta-propeller fold lactonase family protein [Aureimonas sp. ME7]